MRQRFMAQDLQPEEKVHMAGAWGTECWVKTKNLYTQNNCAPERSAVFSLRVSSLL